MCPSFRAPGDELPLEQGGNTRVKTIHTVGSVARVEWKDLGQHPYTGLFKGGTKHGIARFSLALKPDTDELKTAPGIGLKLLRDGLDSANLVAMYSVQGQQSWNFFKHNFSNHIPAVGLSLLPLAAKFSTATRNIRQVGLSDWATHGSDGAREENPLFPYKLRFSPSTSLQFPDTYTDPVSSQLASISPGSVIYTVYAMDKPEEQGGQEARVAELIATSTIVPSKWGDQHLFFRHQDMAEDLRLRPEWNEDTPQFGFFKKDPSRKSPCD